MGNNQVNKKLGIGVTTAGKLRATFDGDDWIPELHIGLDVLYTVFLRYDGETGTVGFLVDDAVTRAETTRPPLETGGGALIVGATSGLQSAANVLVHELRIFDHALSDQEVVAVFNDMNP